MKCHINYISNSIKQKERPKVLPLDAPYFTNKVEILFRGTNHLEVPRRHGCLFGPKATISLCDWGC